MPDTYTIAAAARLCHCDRRTLQRAVRRGTLHLDANHCLSREDLLLAGYLVTDPPLAAPQATPQEMPLAPPLATPLIPLLERLTTALEGIWHELQRLQPAIPAPQAMPLPEPQAMPLPEPQAMPQVTPQAAPASQTTADAADTPRPPRGRLKLTPRQIRALRDKHLRGVPVPALMEEYSLSRISVYRYLRSPQRRASPPTAADTTPPEPALDLIQGADTPEPQPPPRTRSGGRSGRPPGPLRLHILTLLQAHPEGLRAEELRVYLQTPRPIGDTLQGMLKGGVITAQGRGHERRYVATALSPHDQP